jgi:hypothetical protein
VVDGNITFNSTGMITVPVNRGLINAGNTVLADDTAVQMNPDLGAIGFFLFYSQSVPNGNAVGFVSFRATTGPFVHIMPSPSPANILNGWTGATLTGAVGPDTKVNIGCNGTANDLRVENRSGVSLQFRLLRLAI